MIGLGVPSRSSSLLVNPSCSWYVEKKNTILFGGACKVNFVNRKDSKGEGKNNGETENHKLPFKLGRIID